MDKKSLSPEQKQTLLRKISQDYLQGNLSFEDYSKQTKMYEIDHSAEILANSGIGRYLTEKFSNLFKKNGRC